MNLKVLTSLYRGAKKVYTGVKKIPSSVKKDINIIKESRAEFSHEALTLKRLEAKNFVASIPEETWNKISKAVFEQPGETSSIFLDKLKKSKKFYQENGIEIPKDVQEAYNTLEHKAVIFAERMAKAKSLGKEPKNYYKFGEKFKRNNKDAIEKLRTFSTEQFDIAFAKSCESLSGLDYDSAAVRKYKELYTKCAENRNIFYFTSEDLFNSKISAVSEELIQKGQTFYHGTTHQRAISKNGFSLIPKKTQAAAGPRELGQGVYITPDKRVASFFAKLHGGILPLKVDTQKVAAVNDMQSRNMLSAIHHELGQKSTEPANLELIVSELFKRNGYNAAYTRETLGKGAIGDLLNNQELVDKVAGGKQSQLAVFDPKDITILDKSLKDRVSNEAMQIGTAIKVPFITINHFISIFAK